jgi:hypothetical protein
MNESTLKEPGCQGMTIYMVLLVCILRFRIACKKSIVYSRSVSNSVVCTEFWSGYISYAAKNVILQLGELGPTKLFHLSFQRRANRSNNTVPVLSRSLHRVLLVGGAFLHIDI